MFRSIWYKIRGTVVGAARLLREYLAPIAAFVVVFGATWYFTVGPGGV